jgi:uncharacterized protein (DUF2235 family)
VAVEVEVEVVEAEAEAGAVVAVERKDEVVEEVEHAIPKLTLIQTRQTTSRLTNQKTKTRNLHLPQKTTLGTTRKLKANPKQLLDEVAEIGIAVDEEVVAIERGGELAEAIRRMMAVRSLHRKENNKNNRNKRILVPKIVNSQRELIMHHQMKKSNKERKNASS